MPKAALRANDTDFIDSGAGSIAACSGGGDGLGVFSGHDEGGNGPVFSAAGAGAAGRHTRVSARIREVSFLKSHIQ